MRSPILGAVCLILAPTCLYGQAANGPSFEVASIKPAPESAPISCSGGPGTTDPSLWRCSSVPLGLLIAQGYGFTRQQFRPNDPCCLERFEITARVPQGATREQFNRMIQNLLEERFKLKLRHEKKEMPVYRLTVAESGLKMKESPAGAPAQAADPFAPPEFTLGKDGYPAFPGGRGGPAGANGHYHWVGFGVSLPEMIRTLSYYVDRPMLDATALTGKYDVDLKWWLDLAWALERAGYPDLAKDLPDPGSRGPTLARALQDQLGLKLTPAKGLGDIVLVDHLEKVPIAN